MLPFDPETPASLHDGRVIVNAIENGPHRSTGRLLVEENERMVRVVSPPGRHSEGHGRCRAKQALLQEDLPPGPHPGAWPGIVPGGDVGWWDGSQPKPPRGAEGAVDSPAVSDLPNPQGPATANPWSRNRDPIGKFPLRGGSGPMGWWCRRKSSDHHHQTVKEPGIARVPAASTRPRNLPWCPAAQETATG